MFDADDEVDMGSDKVNLPSIMIQYYSSTALIKAFSNTNGKGKSILIHSRIIISSLNVGFFVNEAR
jgi:hypothetical protein